MRSLLLVAVAVAALAAAETDPPPVVFLPFDRVDATLARGQGVWLPYERALDLWQHAARDQERGAPLAAMLDEVAFTGAVAGDVATVTMRGVASGLADGWSQVELPADLAPTRFVADDARVVLARDANALRLHLPGRGRFPFTASLLVPISRDAAGRHSFAMAVPSAAAVRLDLVLDAHGAQPEVSPDVAVTRADDPAGTRITATLGGEPAVSIVWQPAAEVAGGEPLVVATEQARVTAGERSLRVDGAIELQILRRPLAAASVAIPDGYQVLAADAPELAGWTTADGRVELRPNAPVSDRWTVALRLERALPPLAAGESRRVELALPLVVGAARTSGHVALLAGDGVAASLDRADALAQIDPGELPEGLRAGAVAGWRFLAAPGGLTATVARLAPELRADLKELVRLGGEEDTLVANLSLDVRKAGVFALTLSAPERWEIADVSGIAYDELQPLANDHERRRWRLALRSRLIGAASAIVRLRAAPTLPRDEAARDGVIVAPLLLDDARRETITLALAAPTRWALASLDRRGLTPVDAAQLAHVGPFAGYVSELRGDESLALAFAGVDARGASLVLGLTPRSRELALIQEELITLDDGRWKRVVTWRGEVRYAPADAIVVRAPSSLDDAIRFQHPGLAERAIVARDAAAGVTTWRLRFQNPVLGALTLTAEAAGDLPPLPAGKAVRYAADPITLDEPPRLGVVAAVARRGALEVTVGAEGMTDLAASDLPAGLHGEGVVAAFRGATDAPVVASVTRHDLMPLVDLSIAQASYVAVIAEDGLARVKGRLDVVDAGRPYLALKLPEGATLLELAAAGRQARPTRRPEDGAVLVRLDDAERRQPIAFVYEQRVAPRLGAGGRVALALPVVADTTPPIPVERTDLQLWLPHALRALALRGDLQPSDAPASLSDGDGLSIRFAPAGRSESLQRVGEGGVVRVVYLHEGWLRAAVVACAIASAAAIGALRRRAIVACAIGVAAVAAWLLAEGPAASVAAAAVFGIVVMGVIMIARRAIALAIEVRRRARHGDLPAVADPWLEPPSPPPGDAPTSGGAS